MERFEQLYKLHGLLKQRRTPISHAELETRFECSRATLNRLLSFYRNRFNAPLVYDRELKGYYLAHDSVDAFELPGLWFNASELLALMTSHRLLAEVQPGVLTPYLAPLQQRIESLLQDKLAGSTDIFQRIRILPMAQRESRLEDFQQIAGALVNRERLRIQYSSRSRDELTERWISPQRLIHYRDNWYLDAWCHKRKSLRTFALDRLNVAGKGQVAKDVADQDLDRHLTPGYGIFAGPATDTAVLHFSAWAAKWVADEIWHPAQQSRLLDSGRWELTVPYGDPRELLMDILKYGPEVEVVKPASLRKLVRKTLNEALKNYKK